MERKQKQLIEAFERVQAFVDTHPLPGGTSYGAPKTLLDAAVARLNSHGTTQESGIRRERGELVKLLALARKLRSGHLRPIAQIARAVLPHAVEIDALLRTPGVKVPPRLLVMQAEAVRGLAAMHEALLITSGCEQDFLAQLDAAIAALQASLMGRALSMGSRVGARQGLSQEIGRGHDAVQMIDAIVRRRFADRDDTLAEWRIARRVRGIGGPPRSASETPDSGVLPPVAA